MIFLKEENKSPVHSRDGHAYKKQNFCFKSTVLNGWKNSNVITWNNSQIQMKTIGLNSFRWFLLLFSFSSFMFSFRKEWFSSTITLLGNADCGGCFPRPFLYVTTQMVIYIAAWNPLKTFDQLSWLSGRGKNPPDWRKLEASPASNRIIYSVPVLPTAKHLISKSQKYKWTSTTQMNTHSTRDEELKLPESGPRCGRKLQLRDRVDFTNCRGGRRGGPSSRPMSWSRASMTDDERYGPLRGGEIFVTAELLWTPLNWAVSFDSRRCLNESSCIISLCQFQKLSNELNHSDWLSLAPTMATQ